MSRYAELRARWRQRRHHRAFHIAPPVDADGLHKTWERLLAEIADPAPEPRAETLDEKQLAAAATNLWRARRRLERDDGAPTKRERQTRNYLRTCHDALVDAGVVIQDHDGDAFHSGRSIEVLVFEPDPTATEERVLETVRPTIYLHDRRIQMGQVIVTGPPEEAKSTPPTEPGEG
ncbi:hypothetical protein [Actinoalloteichus hymeniacidonis]|uniref:GrpE protein n=1 Tax=Actinoalloteichus hymeniacidonis TaxID=340345 RepID=A0AAC9HS44_9PSEU|nr:hypothetical protein [Actinoalloteichus hymeniacidonis]AOS64579.1 hypothetical protein TL08_18940 [Actinoalloteichus hymeniacidonis]MBB5907349.1 hypothetical protein [Actinoalloteichus hymeniacidonis]